MFLLQNPGAKLLLAITITELIMIGSVIRLPTYNYHVCSDDTASTNYNANLRTLLESLSSKAASDTFYNDTSDGIFGLYLCRGDVTSDLCQNCVATASQGIRERCPSNKTAIIWYDECMLRYSNINFFGVRQLSPRVFMWNLQNNTSPDEPNLGALAVIFDLVDKVPYKPMMYGAKDSDVGGNGSQFRYGLVQCSRDINSSSCRNCLGMLTEDINWCCQGKRGWRILAPSCNLRYEEFPFFTPPAPPPSVSDAPPPSVSDAPPPPVSEESKGKKIAIGVSVSVFVAVALLGSGIYYWRRRRIIKKEERENMQEVQLLELGQGTFVDDYSTENFQEEMRTKSKEFPSIQLDIILIATKHFSEENKLGEGGFGPVYKGTLPDGKEIAVKRLSKTSGQGLLELKNEVTMIARLQHRNLVRLLGCCLEGNEALLIYEYMPNKSLDVFLFDSTKGAELDWKRRLLIINGIARGLLYLHEDSRLRIIHRDLKASNVLLDHEMNPKISDFGMARIFGGNQSEANTIRVVGTYGYMAPEYAMEGLFSVKSDVFSFGVLLLEIISGKKNSGFHHSERSHSLLTFAWKLWSEGRGLELVDPLLVQSCVASEVSKCIHIGLLCVQEDPADRPTMSFVVVMLASNSVTLPQPTQPAFSVGRHALIPTQSSLDVNGLSANEVTVSDMSPR